jgi:hypothetical protein
VERLEQHVGHAPRERLGAIREMLGAADQHDRQIEQLGVGADRGAQALQVVVIVAGGDQCDVEIVTMQALDRGIGGLGIGRRGGPAQGGQDLDRIAAGRADQQDADPIDRRQAGAFRSAGHTEVGEQGIAPPPFDLDGRKAGQRPDARLQLGIGDRQDEYVIGAKREGVGHDCRRLVGGGDDDGEIARRRAGLDAGQQRQAMLHPGVDQHDVGAIGGQRRGRALVAVAQRKRATPVAQPCAQHLQRLIRPLQYNETSRLSHAHASP